MNRAVALLVSVSLLGCFPHNARNRTYAKLGEGAAILAGIAVGASAGTRADCDQMAMPGVDNSACKDRASLLSTLGVVLIVGGLVGFVATVSTAEEEKKAPPPIDIKAEPEKPTAQATAPGLQQATSPAGGAAPGAAGSGAGSDASAGSTDPNAGSAVAPVPQH